MVQPPLAPDVGPVLVERTDRLRRGVDVGIEVAVAKRVALDEADIAIGDAVLVLKQLAAVRVGHVVVPGELLAVEHGVVVHRRQTVNLE